jgi:hypothetical protein
MATNEYRAFAGARAKLFINDKLVGWATGVSGQETISLQRIDVLGNIDSQEIEAVSRMVTMTADFVRILKNSLQEQGLWPKGGTADIINFPEMNAEIYDDIDDQAVVRIIGLKAESRNWRVDRAGVMTQNCTFQGRKMTDESGV